MSSARSEDSREYVMELADACLNGSASTDQVVRLERLLQEDPDARRFYLEFIHDSHSLRNWALAQTDQVEAAWPPKQPLASSRHAQGSRRGLRVLGSLLLAAVAAVVLIVATSRNGQETPPNDVARSDGRQTVAQAPAPPRESVPPEELRQVVAFVERARDCVWTDDALLTTGDELTQSRRLRLQSGMVHLRFVDGATMTLEGPADLELLSASSTQLNAGTLLSTVPEAAVGFRVRTDAMDVTDLGTQFGVTVGSDGETRVSVFAGRVEVALNNSSGATARDQLPRRVLQQGESVRRAPATDVIEQVDFLAAPFLRTARDSTGIESMQGQCRYVIQRVVAGALPMENDRMLVGLEKRDVVLRRDLKVSLRPGFVPSEPGMRPEPLAAGTQVDCFLFQFHPDPRSIPQQGATAVAQITFDRPVLAVIASGKLLEQSDRVFAEQPSKFTWQQRGGESPSPREPREQDVLVVSDDHRTIEVTSRLLKNMDQMRVLVAATDEDTLPTGVPEESPLN